MAGKKIHKEVGGNYLVKSGSHYSGEYGDCIEAIESKRHGLMLRLDLASGMMWFNVNELEEF